MIVNARFNGPPNSGNGGYVAGLMAKEIGGVVQVTLHKPPPLDVQMKLTEQEEEWTLTNRNTIVARAKNSTLSIEPKVIPSMADAVLCETRYPGFKRHAFPHCFVCGPQRSENDGLRLFTGVSGSGDYVAAPFRAFDDLYNEAGQMSTEFIWSALDCPGAYAITQIQEEKVLVLGRMTVDIKSPIDRSEKLIVSGWYLGTERKKNYSGSAIINSDGEVKAIGEATWIEVDPKDFTS